MRYEGEKTKKEKEEMGEVDDEEKEGVEEAAAEGKEMVNIITVIMMTILL